MEFYVEMKQSLRNAGMHTNKLDDNIIQCHEMSVKLIWKDWFTSEYKVGESYIKDVNWK